MDKIIKTVKRSNGFKMGNKKIKIFCYAVDASLISGTEDDLQ